MRKKLFILALLLITGLVPASSNKIVLKWKATFQNGGSSFLQHSCPLPYYDNDEIIIGIAQLLIDFKTSFAPCVLYVLFE